jgi:hypothetical protein
MQLGGVILGAGMPLNIAEGDYLYGTGDIYLIIKSILSVHEESGTEWVVIDGQEKIRNNGPWRYRKVQVRVSALKKALIPVAA